VHTRPSMFQSVSGTIEWFRIWKIALLSGLTAMQRMVAVTPHLLTEPLQAVSDTICEAILPTQFYPVPPNRSPRTQAAHDASKETFSSFPSYYKKFLIENITESFCGAFAESQTSRTLTSTPSCLYRVKADRRCSQSKAKAFKEVAFTSVHTARSDQPTFQSLSTT
jgi:hypothetical protein